MESAKLLEAIIDNAIDGIITIDHRGIVESINPAALHLFGYAPEDKLRQHAVELEEKVRERTRDLITLVGELEKAKADVSISLEKEKELNQLKSRFVSMASHEFRTPLSSVQLSASLIERYLEKPDHNNVIKHTNRIRGSVKLLNDILNDFLSLEKLEAGRVVVNKHHINLVQLSEEITEEMQMICKKNQHIVYQHTGAVGVFLVDEHLVKSSIINLISNAIKYSGEDTFIEFTTEIKDNTCVVCVCDNGIGIPVEDQKNLFEPFFRANNTGSIPGTGLGLNIVKRYVSLMGGTLEYKSALNEGAMFKMVFWQ